MGISGIVRAFGLKVGLSFFLLSMPAYSSPVTFSLKTGFIRNLQRHGLKDLPQFSFYPEFQIETNIVRWKQKEIQVNGGVYWGYWRDGVEQETDYCRDCYTFSYSSHILGTRLLIGRKRKGLDTWLFVGASRHLFHAGYIGGYGYRGIRGGNSSGRGDNGELGLRVGFPVRGRLRLVFETQQHFNLNGPFHPFYRRAAYNIGLSSSL